MATTNEDLADICRLWTPQSLALFYDWIQKDADPNTPIKFPNHLWPVALGLCDNRINKLMLQIGPGSGKSLLLSQVYPAWVLGHDPKKTIMTISGAEDLASGFLGTVMHIVEHSKPFRLAYPDVVPDKNRGWSMGNGAFVKGARIAQPDASYNAFGLASKALTGKHAGLIILDDIHDSENSATKEQCSKVTDRYSSQIVGRAESTGARFLLAGRRWSVHDLYGTLEKSGGWVVLRLPAERPQSELLYYDVYVPNDLECVFTDGFCQMPDGQMVYSYEGKLPAKEPIQRANKMSRMRWPFGRDPMKQGFFWPESPQKRMDYFEQKHMNPSITKAVYQCDPASVETAVFLEEDFGMLYSAPDEIELGRANSPTVDAFCGQGQMVVQAWDTAFSATSTADHSVCITALLIYNDQYRNNEDPELIGPCEPHYIIRVLDVKRVKLSFSEVVQDIRAEYMKWRPNTIVIENKAYAVAAIELLKNSGLPLEPVTPEISKRGRAVEGLGAGSAQGWFRQKRVEFPDNDPEWLQPLKEEMLDFTGDPGRTDDQVDSMVHLVRWAIMEGTGAIMPTGWQTVEEVNARMRTSDKTNQVFGGDMLNPFDTMCGSCAFYKTETGWCRKHQFSTVSIGSCDDHRLNSDPEIKPIIPDMANFSWTMNV